MPYHKEELYSIHDLTNNSLEIHKEYELVEVKVIKSKNINYYIYRINGALSFIWGNRYLDYIWSLTHKHFMLYPFCNLTDKKEYVRPIPIKKGKKKVK